jgi:hypothetical protein
MFNGLVTLLVCHPKQVRRHVVERNSSKCTHVSHVAFACLHLGTVLLVALTNPNAWLYGRFWAPATQLLVAPRAGTRVLFPFVGGWVG